MGKLRIHDGKISHELSLAFFLFIVNVLYLEIQQQSGTEVKIFEKSDSGDGKNVECPRTKDIFNPTDDEQGEICYRGPPIIIEPIDRWGVFLCFLRIFYFILFFFESRISKKNAAEEW